MAVGSLGCPFPHPMPLLLVLKFGLFFWNLPNCFRKLGTLWMDHWRKSLSLEEAVPACVCVILLASLYFRETFSGAGQCSREEEQLVPGVKKEHIFPQKVTVWMSFCPNKQKTFTGFNQRAREFHSLFIVFLFLHFLCKLRPLISQHVWCCLISCWPYYTQSLFILAWSDCRWGRLQLFPAVWSEKEEKRNY